MTPNKITLLGSVAIMALASSPAFAQDRIRISEDALLALDTECQDLVALYNSADLSADAPPATEAVQVINANDGAECATFLTGATGDAIMEDDEEMVAEDEPADSDEILTPLEGDETEMVEGEETEMATDEETVVAEDEETAEMTEEVSVAEQATIEGQAIVTVPEPEVDVELDPPAVTVRNQNPSVTVNEGSDDIQVRQQQPEVSVEIPEIIVTIEIPAPEIFIQRGETSVDVAMADPMVDVEQNEPRIVVRQAEPEISLDLDVDNNADASGDSVVTTDGDDGARVGGDVEVTDAAPTVTIIEAEGEAEFAVNAAEPTVTFEGAQPNVSVTFTQEPTIEIVSTGSPVVTFETMEEREQRVSGEGEMATEDMTEEDMAEGEAAEGEMMDEGNLTVAEVMDMEILTADGENIGEAEAVIERNGQMELVVSDGGFLGMGQTQVAVPMSAISVQDGMLVLENLTEEQIETATDFEYSDEMVLDDELGVTFN